MYNTSFFLFAIFRIYFIYLCIIVILLCYYRLHSCTDDMHTHSDLTKKKKMLEVHFKVSYVILLEVCFSPMVSPMKLLGFTKFRKDWCIIIYGQILKLQCCVCGSRKDMKTLCNKRDTIPYLRIWILLWSCGSLILFISELVFAC